jgi:hypothetical protein
MKVPSELTHLARSLAKVQWICPGSLVQQYQLKHRGGRALRYGPYLIWTRKIDDKTVTLALSQPQARFVAQAIANRRRLEKAIARMQHLTVNTILKQRETSAS